ncbi:MAG: TonB-dependent receptor plug domain-containing protein [Campylobacteraceae bacterium]|jgi:hypothetical protein|nr:TonB-dependent receptor plug domain-containing protein [Campylobacteraceae bacterium]
MILSNKKTVFALSLLACMDIYAQTNSEVSNETSSITELSAIEVRAAVTSARDGLMYAEKIANTPTPTNSITDALRSSSSIQFSSNSRSSATGGEIAPPKVSVKGAQHYENNFMISGVSNNNNLNPAGLGYTDGWYGAAAGEAQSLFIDTSLVESISAQTEAISAEYGSFTGGVIDAKLKDANMDRWHFLAKYRYTDDGWAKYHLTDEQKNIDKSTSESYQPEFNKYEYAISADGPISDHVGLMLSYANQHSKIPLWSAYDINASGVIYKERRTQYRDNKNYLIKLNTYNIDDLEASLTAIYAPYTHSTFMESFKDSDQDIKGGGYNIAYDMKNELNFGTFKNTLAYQSSENSLEGHNSPYFAWAYVPDGYANWRDGATTREGTHKNRDLSQNSFIYKGVLNLDEIETGSFVHLVKTGIEAEVGKARYKKDESVYFNVPVLDPTAVGERDDGVITGEQYVSSKTVYEAIDNKRSYTTAALFLEDSIKFDRYTLRSGVRISTDTITDNTNVAPRFFANADVFNDKVWNIYGGYNRYYGGLILYNAINKAVLVQYKRSAANAQWVKNGWVGNMDYSLDGLETPHSDEFSIGSSLAKWDTIFKLDFVNREHKDQLKTKRNIKTITPGSTGYDYNFVNTNDGESSYWGITLSVSKEYELGSTRHSSELSATNSKTKSNMNGLYGFINDGDYSFTHVTYDGVLTELADVPAANYNSPWVVTYTHAVALSNYLNFGLNARYEKGVHGFKWRSNSGGLSDPSGLPTRVYESKNYGDIFTVDLSANYNLKFGENKLLFGVEILNLFNRKNDASYAASDSNIDGYAMGQQFYANVKYEY